jgi:hypothetical protein
MRHRGAWVVLWLAAAVAGCRMSDRYDVPPPLTDVDRAAHLRDREAEARQILLAKLESLSPEDRARIEGEPSRVGQYVMSRAYGQYFFNWQLGDGRTAYVMWTGDVTAGLDPASVHAGVRAAGRYGK